MNNSLRGEFTFSVGKKKYDAVLTLNALRLMCQQFKMPLDKLDKWMAEDPLTAVPAFCYYGAKNAALRKNKSIDLPDFDVWCAQCLDDQDTVESMMAAVSEALGGEEEASEKGN
jgi:hypothetical protein